MSGKKYIVEKNNLYNEVNEAIKSFLPAEEGHASLIFEALNYSVLNGGKRVRPMMLLASYRAFGGDEELVKELVYPFLSALEMIHSYSLVHDDLPEMDNDMYRRGNLTTHAKYGQAVGVLAGDALLNFAFETALKAGKNIRNIGRDDLFGRVLHAMDILAEKAGVYGMVGGQTVDVIKTGQNLTADELDFIYSLKTGALLQSALMIGAALAGASNEEIEEMGKIGRYVGLAFQIQDDILDETSTTEVLGKPVHSDLENKKTTYVTIYGLDVSTQEVVRLTDKANEIMENLDLDGDFLQQMFEEMISRDK